MVDDDPDFIYLNKIFLENKGYQVITAYDGEEGIRRAKENKPDLIVLDVMMNRLTEGFDVSRKIREENELKKIPVIMLTGIRKKQRLPWTFEPDKNWLPVDKFMEKPISPEKLLNEIEKILK